MNSPSLVVAACVKSANKTAVGLTEVVFVDVCVDSEKVPIRKKNPKNFLSFEGYFFPRQQTWVFAGFQLSIQKN